MSTSVSLPKDIRTQMMSLHHPVPASRMSALEALSRLSAQETPAVRKVVLDQLKVYLSQETNPNILAYSATISSSWAAPAATTRQPSPKREEIQSTDMVDLEMDLAFEEPELSAPMPATPAPTVAVDLTNSSETVAPKPAPAKKPTPTKPTSTGPSAFNLLMGQSSKKRSPPGELAGWGRAKKPKMSANESKYVPSSAAQFLSKLSDSSGSGSLQEMSTSMFSVQKPSSSSSTNDKPDSAMMVTGYDTLGVPNRSASPSSPQRSPFLTKGTPSLPSYITPKSLQKTRPLGTLANVQSNARSIDLNPTQSATFASSSSTAGFAFGYQEPPSTSFSTSLPPAPNRRPLPGMFKEKSFAPSSSYPTTGGTSSMSKTTPAAPRRLDLSEITISPELSSEQRKIVEKAIAGESFFFTGPAGTGKSFVLKEIIRVMRETRDVSEFAVVAPTGMAAVQLGGTTIHSWAGIGLGKKPQKELLADVKRNGKTQARWKATQVLIIDEISMLGKALFDKLHFIANAVRDKPNFGGMQLICCGDFFQLPPIVTAADRDSKDGNEDEETLAFQSKNWKNCITRTYTLKTVFRQVGDLDFVAMLNELRQGKVSDATYAKLCQCVRKVLPPSNVEPTRLFPRKDQVATYNANRLAQLSGQTSRFTAGDTLKGNGNENHKKTLADNCPAPTVLELKLHAQVVLLRNKADHGLVNGSRGVVVGFEQPEKPGMAGWPIVQFESGTKLTITPEKWELQSGGQPVAEREQVPLNLSWALSIHKAQGMTIMQIEVSLKEIFEDGQAYVALSRVTSLSGLRIREEFNRDKISASASVVKWYEQLETLPDDEQEEEEEEKQITHK